MSKVLSIAVGAAAGALGAVVIVLAIAMWLDDSPADAWNFGLGIILFAGLAVAAVLGGLLGGAAGAASHARGLGRGGMVFAGSMALIALLTLAAAAALWAMVSVPRRPPTAGDRERWARGHGPLFEEHGRALASTLLDCYLTTRSLDANVLVSRGCAHLKNDRIGVLGSGYGPGDNGWRWETKGTASGMTLVVRPDPLLNQKGPVFEFGSDTLLLRRESPDAPAHAIGAPLWLLAALHECLLTVRRETPDSSPVDSAAAIQAAARDPRCADLSVTVSREDDTRSHVRVTKGDGPPMQASFYPQGYRRGGAFEFHVVGTGRRYMLAEDGSWHVKPMSIGGPAAASDPAPEACELDPRVPCPTPDARAARGRQDAAHQRMAAAIRRALAPDADDRIIVRYDPAVIPGLERLVQRALHPTPVELLPYGPVADFDARLRSATAYVWLPEGATPTPPEQAAALARWTDEGGTRREVHFHWAAGTLDPDGLPATHTAKMDERYLEALERPMALTARMAYLIDALRSDEVRVTTPAGTDIRFRVGDRPFNRQHGVATGSAARAARIRIDRHIELPAGVIRVAPIETSVNGILVFPSFRIRDGVRASDVRLEFTRGVITRATARDRQAELDVYFSSQPALKHFREFCLGMHPKLAVQPGDTVIPYYGYGEGVVRMSLGDNEELGGAVRGGAVRWNFFTDATVTVPGRPHPLVANGILRPF